MRQNFLIFTYRCQFHSHQRTRLSISSLNGIKFTTTFVRYTNKCSLLDFVKTASRRKQTTLFKYNFFKKVEHKGTLVEIKGKDFLDNESGIFKCTNCKDSFISKQGNLFKFFSLCNFSIF